MVKRLSVAFLLWAALAVTSPGRLFADATITLPTSVNGAVGAFIQVPSTASGPTVKWLALDPGLNLFPTDLLKNSKIAVVTSPTQGQYRIIAWTADASGPSDAATCLIQVGPPAPVPPAPGPTPPGPAPAPTDPLLQALQAAYSADTAANKAAKKELLHALYGVASTDTVNRPDLATVGDLFNALATARKALMADTDLVTERQAIGAYLATKLPTTATAPLDSATRSLAGTEFGKVATALGALQK